MTLLDQAFNQVQRPAKQLPAAIRPASVDEDEARPRVVRLADVEPEDIRWLWPNRIPLGSLTMLAGDPGLGKSLITLDLVARLTRGASWPDSEERCESGGVVLLSAEDDLATTIRPRLDAAGADNRHVVALTAVDCPSGNGKRFDRPFMLDRDLDQLERAIEEVEHCRLVAIDPISAYLGGTDSHRNADVRSVLHPLSELAAKHDVAVVCVTHLRKGDGEALYRAMGSLAFIAAARSAYVVAKDGDDPENRRRLFLPIKSNLSESQPGLAYATWRDHDGISPYVRWLGSVAVDANEALATGRQGEGRDYERREAATWLAELLGDGLPRRATDVEAQATDAGISKGTLRRARAMLGLEVRKAGFDTGWTWRLPMPKVLTEDAQQKEVSAFGGSERLRVFDPENGVSESSEDAAPPEDAQQKEVSAFGDDRPPLAVIGGDSAAEGGPDEAVEPW